MTSTPAVANIPLVPDFVPQAETMLPDAYARLPKGDWRREDMVRNLAYQLACDAKRWPSKKEELTVLPACHRGQEGRQVDTAQQLPAPGCKPGRVSKSKARQKDLGEVGIAQKRATPGTQKSHTPAPDFGSAVPDMNPVEARKHVELARRAA